MYELECDGCGRKETSTSSMGGPVSCVANVTGYPSGRATFQFSVAACTTAHLADAIARRFAEMTEAGK
jgi:hypothetical protein